MCIELLYEYSNLLNAPSKYDGSYYMCIPVAERELFFVFYFSTHLHDINRAAHATFWICIEQH